jgi:TctA family transporter
MMEKTFRHSLIMSRGDFSVFITRPISGVIFSIAIILLILPLIAKGSKRERIASLKDED